MGVKVRRIERLFDRQGHEILQPVEHLPLIGGIERPFQIDRQEGRPRGEGAGRAHRLNFPARTHFKCNTVELFRLNAVQLGVEIVVGRHTVESQADFDRPLNTPNRLPERLFFYPGVQVVPRHIDRPFGVAVSADRRRCFGERFRGFPPVFQRKGRKKVIAQKGEYARGGFVGQERSVSRCGFTPAGQPAAFRRDVNRVTVVDRAVGCIERFRKRQAKKPDFPGVYAHRFF